MRQHRLTSSILAVFSFIIIVGCKTVSSEPSMDDDMLMRGNTETKAVKAEKPSEKEAKAASQSDKLLAQGIQYETAGELESAERAYIKCIEYNDSFKVPKNSATALHRLGVVTARKKEFQRSEDYFRDALKTKPNDTELMCDFAQVLNDQKKFHEAEIVLKNALALAPNDNRVLFFLGHVCGAQEHYQLALRYLKQSVGETAGLRELAGIYRRNGEFEIAKTAERKAIAVQERNAEQLIALQRFESEKHEGPSPVAPETGAMVLNRFGDIASTNPPTPASNPMNEAVYRKLHFPSDPETMMIPVSAKMENPADRNLGVTKKSKSIQLAPLVIAPKAPLVQEKPLRVAMSNPATAPEPLNIRREIVPQVRENESAPIAIPAPMPTEMHTISPVNYSVWEKKPFPPTMMTPAPQPAPIRRTESLTPAAVKSGDAKPLENGAMPWKTDMISNRPKLNMETPPFAQAENNYPIAPPAPGNAREQLNARSSGAGFESYRNDYSNANVEPRLEPTSVNNPAIDIRNDNEWNEPVSHVAAARPVHNDTATGFSDYSYATMSYAESPFRFDGEAPLRKMPEIPGQPRETLDYSLPQMPENQSEGPNKVGFMFGSDAPVTHPELSFVRDGRGIADLNNDLSQPPQTLPALLSTESEEVLLTPSNYDGPFIPGGGHPSFEDLPRKSITDYMELTEQPPVTIELQFVGNESTAR